MKTTSIKISWILAVFSLSILLFSRSLIAAPKGAELLLKKSKSGRPSVSSQTQAPSRPNDSAEQTNSIYSYSVTVHADSEESLLLFEAVARDTTDCIIGVSRLGNDEPDGTRFAFRTSLNSLSKLKEALHVALKRVSQIGLLQQSTVLDAADIPFADATIEEKEGSLMIRLPRPPHKSPSSLPEASLPTPSSAVATPQGGPNFRIANHTESGDRRPSLQAIHYGPSSRVVPVTYNSNEPASRGRKSAYIIFVLSIVLIIFSFSLVGLWVCGQATWRKLRQGYRALRVHRPVTQVLARD